MPDCELLDPRLEEGKENEKEGGKFVQLEKPFFREVEVASVDAIGRASRREANVIGSAWFFRETGVALAHFRFRLVVPFSETRGVLLGLASVFLVRILFFFGNRVMSFPLRRGGGLGLGFEGGTVVREVKLVSESEISE